MANKLSIDIELNSKQYTDGARQAAKATEDVKKATEDYLKDFGPLRKQLAATKKEAQNLAAQYALLGKAEKQSEFGKELKAQMDIAIEKAAELQDVMADTSQAIRNASSDTQTWDALKEGMEVAKSATLAYASAIAKVTGNEKDLAKLVKTLTTIENTFNAAIKIGNALQQQSAVMTSIRKVQLLAAARAEEIGTATTIKATIAQKAFNLVAKANPYVLLASAAITAAVAIGGYMLATSKAAKEEERAAKARKELHDATIQGQKDAQDDIVKVNLLYDATQDLNLKMEDRIDAVKKLQEQYPAYFGNLTQEEILVGNASAAYQQLVEDIMAVAMAKAYEEKIAEKSKENVDLLDELAEKQEKYNKKRKEAEEDRYNPSNAWDGGTVTQMSLDRLQDDVDEVTRKINDNKEAIKKYQQEIFGYGENIRRFAENARKANEHKKGGNDDKVKQQITEYQKLLDKVKEWEKKKENINPLDPKAEEYIKNLNKQIREAQTKADNFKISMDFGLSEDEYKRLQELTAVIDDIKNQIDNLDKTSPDFKELHDNLVDQLKAASKDLTKFKVKIGIELPDPNEYINELKAEQKVFEDAYKIAVSIDDKEAQKKAKEGYEKLQKAIDQEEVEIKNLKLTDVEIKGNELKAKLDKAMADWKLAVQNDDEAAEAAAREAVIVAQRELNTYNLQFQFEFNPDGMTKAEKDINKIFSDLNKNEKQYDISYLPDGFKEQAEQVINRLYDVKDARQKLQDIIDSNKEKALVDPEAADAIQRAQMALAATDDEYKKLIEDAEKFNQVSSQIKERQKDFESFKNTVSSISNVVGTFDSVVSSIESMTNAFEEGKNGWEQFMAVVQTAMSIMNAVITIMEIVNTLQDLANAKKELAGNTVAAEAAAHAANATAQGTEAGTTATLAGVQTASVAPAIALGKAMEKLAAANIFAAHSYIPFAGPVIAAGFVAMMEGVLASIGKLEEFAHGGIIEGSSYGGDKLLARVNSGEMILNDRQQKNLFDIANGIIKPNQTQLSFSEVRIQGSDLILAIKNELKVTGQKTLF